MAPFGLRTPILCLSRAVPILFIIILLVSVLDSGFWILEYGFCLDTGLALFNIHIWDALLMICCNFFEFLLVLYIFLNETF